MAKIKTQFILFITLILSLFQFSCAGKFVVKSDPPNADVFVLDPTTKEKKLIGQTPLEMNEDEFKKNITNSPNAGEFYTVVVEKNGFEQQSYNLPTGQFATLVTSLEIKLTEGETQKEFRLAQEILDSLFLAQKLALTNQFERAHIEIDKVINKFPTFSRALSMRASIYFAQKNYPESLKWFEETLKADPNLEEAIKMTAKLRPLVGGSALRSVATDVKTNQNKTEGKK